MTVRTLLLSLLFAPLLTFAQSPLDQFDQNQTLTAERCYDVIKVVWDGLKALSDEQVTNTASRNEFESTADYNARIQRSRDEYANKIRKFFSDNKLSARSYSVWMKADLVKYDADNQTYGIRSSTQIQIQPKKPDIAITLPDNKYVTISEKNSVGYRRAAIHLNTKPEFTWYVNRQTAQDAKNKETNIYFKLTFTFDISFDDTQHLVNLQIVPTKLALMDKSENFTYWSEEIH